MSAKEKWLWTYRVVRSILFITIIVITLLYAGLYTALSVPGVQNKIRDVAETELSRLLGSRIEIGDVNIYPFNEVIVKDVILYEPSRNGGLPCLQVEKLGAGISLWNLLSRQRIVITYAELIGLDADLRQYEKGSPFNIQFLIEAFAPKKKNKPPTLFDLEIRNIVIRKSAISFDREWTPAPRDGLTDFNHLKLTGLSADMTIPRLRNDDMEFDLRRLACTLAPDFTLRSLKAIVGIHSGDITVRDLCIELSNSTFTLNDIALSPGHYGGDFLRMLKEGEFNVQLHGQKVVPADFACFYPGLTTFQTPFSIILEMSGNMENLRMEKMKISNPYEDMELAVGDLRIVKGDSTYSDCSLGNLDLQCSGYAMKHIADLLPQGVGSDVRRLISEAGDTHIILSGKASVDERQGDVKAEVMSAFGSIELASALDKRGQHEILELDLTSEGIDVGGLTGREDIGKIALDLSGYVALDGILKKSDYTGHHRLSKIRHNGNKTDFNLILDAFDRMLPMADLRLDIPMADIRGYILHDLGIAVKKDNGSTTLRINSDDDNFNLLTDVELTGTGHNRTLNLEGNISQCNPGVIFPFGRLRDNVISGDINMNLEGIGIDDMTGTLDLSHISVSPLRGNSSLQLNHFRLTSAISKDGIHMYTMDSDWLEGTILGRFTPSLLPRVFRSVLNNTFGHTFIPTQNNVSGGENKAQLLSGARIPDNETGAYADLNVKIYPGGDWARFFRLPVSLLYEATLTGGFDEDRKTMHFGLDAPYICQGRDKLIRSTSLNASIVDGNVDVALYSSLPTKKGILDLDLSLHGNEGRYAVEIDLNTKKKGGFYGEVDIDLAVQSALNKSGRLITAHFLPTKLHLNGTPWDIGESMITYSDKYLDVKGFSVSNGRQYIVADGIASSDPEKEIVARLESMDLDYIFDTLNINYVVFGGEATGEAVVKGLFSTQPQIFTRRLDVKNLSYNHSVLGDGKLLGNFDIPAKRIGIFADVEEEGRRVAIIDGGIWLGRDSLSFDLDADKVRIGFLQTFMSAFSSKVEGRASGQAKLFGTFKDIDLAGRLFADTISLHVDFTNVTYSGSDSVYIDPGRIEIPDFRLYDQHGNSARLQGVLNHNCFHDPDFNFRIHEARNLLVYDTDATMNPVWYGRIFGTGGGRITGYPGYVGITADMTTTEGSTFTFVLSDTQEAADYKFLTFTDRRKEAREEEERRNRPVAVTDEIEEAFRKRVEEESGGESVFAMDIRATLTPAAQLTLVMDPIAGDKILARGAGAMNMTYSSDSNDLRMYGKYALSEGFYHFSLQDLILKDFIIKEGSTISFNGDPMNAMLDISAAYRVNTNLTDLDKSFASDRDLNRTNVPVDAMLMVAGEMTHPDISFDIELPTLNDEVSRKVKSIISSEDMMNRQIIYLLALNRFYTPEYMGNSSTGGEWASMASSTLSSQLSNILGQLTDKVNISPTLRSDKGDFSDLEVDLALSSRLFNNRLLVNGNFGYRDKSTSSTTFIGDFDIEYLLNRRGNLRLKAYNHFNDQNYYLKSSLTTQGLGVIWRKDFDRLWRQKRNLLRPSTPVDSISSVYSGQLSLDSIF